MTLKIDALTCTYPGAQERALQNISFELPAGTFTSVIGPSGAGKSTLLRCISGQLPPDSGTILIDGENLVPLRGRARRRLQRKTGMIYQDFRLVDQSTSLVNVLNACLPDLNPLSVLVGHFPGKRREEAQGLLDTVGLSGKAGQRTDQLSGGERQRVAVARALMQGGTLLLADEPVASLDPLHAGEILSLLQSLQRQRGLTVLMNSHHVEQALAYSDRILGLRKGEIVFDGPASQVTKNTLKLIYGGEL